MPTYTKTKPIHDKRVKDLEEQANTLRQDLISMLLTAGSGHSAGPLGMTEVFTALYFHIMNHDPKNPNWAGRDRFILSNGHICPILYVALAHAGYFPVKELSTLRKFGSRLQGHPHKGSTPGVENSSGPLGHGGGIAVGMAMAAKMDGKKYRIICGVSDGEQDEGMTWEAAMFAARDELDNLIFVMDRNNIQIDGFTSDVMPLEPLRKKYESFGWHVIEVDGHNIRDIVDAFRAADTVFRKPVMIIAHTVPGKGVDFMEWKPEWHGKPPNKEEAKLALHELRTLGRRIKGEHE